MNYSEIVRAIDNASGFDLFRLHTAIGRMLDNPRRIYEMKGKIRIGEEIEYFEVTENRAIKARVLEFRRTRVAVRNLEDGNKWMIPYYAINIHKVSTSINESGQKEGLGRNEVSVGDTVGFVDNQNEEHYGKVVRLNQKTVTLDCDGHKWRVSYSFLFKIIGPDVNKISGA